MRNPVTSGDENGESGFALVLTLVVILVLSLVTETMTSWVVTALDDALVNREEADAAKEIAGAEALAVYLLQTRPRSPRGLELLSAKTLQAPPAPGEFAGAVRRGENYI